MKKTSPLALTVLSLALSLALRASAQEHNPLPIPLTIGGQTAVAKAGEPFAKIEKPVAADAVIDVTTKAAMTIINVTPYDLAKKAPVAGGATAIILLQGTHQGSLEKTMDKQKLKAGDYLMSVVADGTTDSVLLQVK